MKLKDYLINEVGCLDNNYLDEYINLLTDYKLTEGYAEIHHAVPVAYYFKKYNCKSKCEAKRRYADKDENNLLVKLLYKDHIKAHWLLYNCTAGYLKQINAKAYKRMLTDKYAYKFEQNLTDAEYNKLQEHMNIIVSSEDTAYWSAEDTKWLLEHYNKMTYEECGVYLHKTALAIQHKIFALNLCKRNMWTNEEIEWLKENRLKMTYKECADYLGRSVDNVRSKAKYLGITTKREQFLDSVRKPKKEKVIRTKMTHEEKLKRKREKYAKDKLDPEFRKKHNEHSRNYYRNKKKGD